jgi:hypothetical protein
MRVPSMMIALFLVFAGGCSDDGTDPVDELPADTAAPTVTTSDLVGYEITKDTRSITVTAADDVGVARVELEVDGVKAAEATVEPFTVEWDTKSTADGVRKVRVVAYDAAENRAETAEVPVIVANTAQPPLWTDLPDSGGVIALNFGVPANWNGNNEMIDQKYHWTMPAGMHRVVATLTWTEPGWMLDYSVGTGWCPDSGIAKADLFEDDGFIILDYTSEAELAGTWFVHMGAKNAADMKGKSAPYVAQLLLFP